MSKVIIQECKDYVLQDIMEKINDGIDKLGGWDLFVKPGDTVLLKANLIGPKLLIPRQLPILNLSGQ